MFHRIICLTAMMFALSVFLKAQTKSATENPSIVEHILSDSISEVNMDPEMEWILEYEAPEAPRRTGNVGYRVQVFSDSNQQTAKNEARTKQRSMASRFPHYPTYVTFKSPYWRVKVGDFARQDEAEEAASAIRRAFPSFARDVRVVRDLINVSKNANN